MNKMIKKIIGILTLAAVFVTPVFAGQGASAASTEEIYEKILVNNIMSTCYGNGLISDIKLNNYIDFGSLMNEGYKDSSGSNSFYVPQTTNGYETKISNNKMSCYQAFAGGDGKKGLLEIYNKTIPARSSVSDPIDPKALTNFMSDVMSYKVDNSGVGLGEYCYTVYAKIITGQPTVLGKACVSKDNYPLNLKSQSITFGGGDEGSGYILTGGLTQDSDGNAKISVTVKENGARNCMVGEELRSCSKTVKLSGDEPSAGDKPNIKVGDTTEISFNDWVFGRQPEIYVKIEENDSQSASSLNVGYKKGYWSDFVTNLTGKGVTDFALNDAERYDLYVDYLKKYYAADVSLGGTECQANKPAELVDGDKYYAWTKNNGWCALNLSAQKASEEHSMTIFSKGSNVLTSVINTLPKLIEAMGELDYSDPSLFADIDADTNANGAQNNNEDKDKCFDSAGALGWVLCPITSGLATLGSSAYNWIEENFLQVRASIFTESDNGVQNAWGTVRDFANAGFVIMLLVVVFSQVTGVGIDNYGIKRILPKIIIGAILMNLSYIICELAIDVSNILGNGLNDLLTNMGPDFSGAAGVDDPSIAQYLIVGGTGVLATATYLILTSGGLGAILLLFIAILTVVVSILVLFVILIVRQAGIVICVVVAPIAILCYLLPNTEKVFKKWWELMKGLLLVYPLCGLVIGAGGFIGKVFGNLAVGGSGDMQMGFALSAMVVQVIPYLFIPMLLRSSLAAMGNLGARISGFGSRFTGGISKRVRESDAMKASRQRAKDASIMRKAGYDEKRGGLNAIGRAKAKFARTKLAGAIGYTRMQNSRMEMAEKIRDANRSASASLASETAAADIAEYLSNHPGGKPEDYYQDLINNADGDVGKIETVILTAQKRGMKNKDVANMLRTAQNDGRLTFKDSVSRANWMNHMLRNHVDMVSTDYDLQEWMRDGGNGRLGDYGDYMRAHRNVSDIDISDLSKMSGNSLAGAIKAGFVSSSVAQQWLASNPNQSVDKKVMMGAVASGSITASDLNGVSASDFKAEADALASGNQAGATHIVAGARRAGKSDGTLGSMESLVDSWTAPSQVRTYISQDSSTMKPGQEQRDPVRVTMDGAIDVRTSGDGGSTGQIIDVRALGDETLLDIATNPNASMSDATRTAAEQEYLRRNPGTGGNPPQNVT